MIRPARQWLLALCFWVSASAAAAQEAEQVFEGVLTRADHGAYREIAFDVPPETARLYIEIIYERGEPWAAIDMAVYDTQRFRGASIFSKTLIDIGEYDATPSYLPGPLPEGRWRLVLGGANAPEGRETPYSVRIRAERRGRSAPAFARMVRDAPGWYRGDFHAHTGHSDGYCTALSGARAPCPVFRTLEAAAARGLDFIAVTDHNTVSHLQSLRELSAYFDTLAIIAAQEVTTYRGHMNVFGPAAPIEFRLGAAQAPDVETLAAHVSALGGVLSINHPGISLSEGCPGCGWSAPVTDYAGVAAVEVVNGVVAGWGEGPEGPASSLPFWIARLNEGRRIAAIGGSDNHTPTDTETLSSVGGPSTVVYAATLSPADILAGVRAGHVFIDVEGVRERFLALTATRGHRSAMMGETIAAARGALVSFAVETHGAPEGARLEIWRDGAPFETDADDAPLAANETRRFSWRSDGARHWFSANVRAEDGRLILIGNPIYINFPS
ncbi:MAG: CehA/McbA family metallohydrolase [Hyphomonadaceae bacterium]|nr:CehA/McbA family metallohydrolase [Hyphomonadaceae bacterium]GIK49464.1 MAG: phosphoesterase [Alphaproteobacteria bacterium]